MKKRKSRDPLTIHTDLEDVKAWLAKVRAESAAKAAADIERIKATVAEFRAAGQQDAAAMEALFDDSLKKIDQIEQMGLQTIRFLGQALAAQPEDWRAPRAVHRRKRAAAIRREVKARADELKQSGVRNPVAQALKEAAERWGHASGRSLGRWMRRNRR